MRAILTSSTFSYVEAQKFIIGNPNLTSEIKLSAFLLTTPAWIVHLIISYNLLPHDGHHDEVTYMDAFLIFHILQGRPINLAHIILSYMIDALSHMAKSLPFGTFLCHIFSSRGITAPSIEILSGSFERLTTFTLQKMGYKIDEPGQWVLKYPPRPRTTL